MVIRVLSDATVVASAFTAARAAAPESVIVAEAVPATRAATGSDAPPVAEIVTVPPPTGMKTVYSIDPAFAPDVELEFAFVVIETAVKLSAVVVVPANVRAEEVVIPPAARRFAKVAAAKVLPALSSGVT